MIINTTSNSISYLFFFLAQFSIDQKVVTLGLCRKGLTFLCPVPAWPLHFWTHKHNRSTLRHLCFVKCKRWSQAAMFKAGPRQAENWMKIRVDHKVVRFSYHKRASCYTRFSCCNQKCQIQHAGFFFFRKTKLNDGIIVCARMRIVIHQSFPSF